ncbi:hypothetical protein ACEWY4_008045 [Coilia grayii]|uniref:Uncharacterized protein n=1 Tax=Coilia grayii TaxID=363190 RepID=A0ABD1K9Y6_9TELE
MEVHTAVSVDENNPLVPVHDFSLDHGADLIPTEVALQLNAGREEHKLQCPVELATSDDSVHHISDPMLITEKPKRKSAIKIKFPMHTSKGGVASLQQWIKRVEIESVERQNALEEAKERNDAVRSENANLKLAIRKLSPKFQQIGSKREELNKLHSQLEESSKRRSSLQSRLRELQKENSNLQDELESGVGEMSSLEHGRQADRQQIRALTSCVNTLERQAELGQICLQQEEEETRWRDATINELNSAILERMEILKMLDVRKSQLEAELSRPPEEIQSSVGLSIYEEIRMCTLSDLAQETLPVASKRVSKKEALAQMSVLDRTLRPTYWRMAAVLSWISFAVGFATIFLC